MGSGYDIGWGHDWKNTVATQGLPDKELKTLFVSEAFNFIEQVPPSKYFKQKKNSDDDDDAMPDLSKSRVFTPSSSSGTFAPPLRPLSILSVTPTLLSTLLTVSSPRKVSSAQWLLICNCSFTIVGGRWVSNSEQEVRVSAVMSTARITNWQMLLPPLVCR